jgi:hypothetical protein
VHDKMRPPGFDAMADGRGEVLAGAHAMDRSQQRRLRQTASRVPCADGWPEWHGRHASACAGGSRACGHGGGCWAGTYACSRVVPHAGGGVISDPSFPPRIGAPSGAVAQVWERGFDGHRSFTDLRPVNTRRVSRRPTSQRYGRAGDRSNRRTYGFHTPRVQPTRRAGSDSVSRTLALV